MKTTSFNLLSAIRNGLLSCMIVLSLSGTSSATHIVGGEITYEWLNGNVYRVTLAYYRDCAGISAPNLTLYFRSVSCGQGPLLAGMTLIGAPVTVTPICAASMPNASCNGGTLYSVERRIYQAVVTLPASCSDWEFYYTECCRNGAITNLDAPGTRGSYFSAMLNNLDVPFNNSVQFNVDPINIIPNGVASTLTWSSYDMDGDSLFYELVSARDFTSNIPYVSNYTFLQPFAVSTPLVFNSANGDIQVTPNALQTSVVCMKISEYRNGIFIGSVYRDFQIAVVNSTNTPPALSGMDGTNNFITNGCPGDTITFDVLSYDPDAGQTLTIEMIGQATGASFTALPGTNPTGTFSWIPTTNDISSQPYVYSLTVSDDYCDYYGKQTFAYHIYVNGCNTNDVWPGDANSDGNANLYDLLAIGLAYNDNGPVRPSANFSWTAQVCPNWNNSFLSGINHKHADTDGNGVVDMNDTTAIMLNYGLNHPLRIQPDQSMAIADLTVTANLDTVGTMMTVNFDISISSPIDSIYGLAFRLFLDPTLVDMGTATVTYPGSMFGTNGVDMVKIDKTFTGSGFIDVALTRIDHLNLNGTGPVARITIVTTDNVSGKVTLNVEPMDVEAVTADGSGVILNTVGDGVVIDPAMTGLNESLLSAQISLFPVPSGDFVHFSYSGNEKIEELLITDASGREVFKKNNISSTEIVDMRYLDNGVYMLKARIGGLTVYRKIVKI